MLCLLIKGDCFCSSDAGILEHRCPNSKDTLLGPRDGWLAPPAGHTPTEMVPLGYWTGRNERIGFSHINSEHAHHHVLVLPKQVSWMLKNKQDFVQTLFAVYCLLVNINVCKS